MSHASRQPPRERPVATDEQDWTRQPMPAACVAEAKQDWSADDDGVEADVRLAQRVEAGEREAVRELYQRYAPTLLRRLQRMLGGNMSQAEDCLQQVFVKALEAIDQYEGRSSLHAWLNRITSHAVADVYRAQKSQRSLFQRFRDGYLSAWRFDGNQTLPEARFLREEQREMIHRGLEGLGKNKRMAVVLCDIEGYTVEEAAVEMDVPIGTMASRLFRGRQKLKAWLTRSCRRSGGAIEDWFHE